VVVLDWVNDAWLVNVKYDPFILGDGAGTIYVAMLSSIEPSCGGAGRGRSFGQGGWWVVVLAEDR
jgi:hypothetical protein